MQIFDPIDHGNAAACQMMSCSYVDLNMNEHLN